MRQPLASEILGFSSHARVLLVNADDFGMHPAINHGVLAALDRGIARSTSLMTTCPASRDAIDLLRRRPDVAFGVHLTLVRDLPVDDWAPRAPAQEIPSLVDASGRLPLHAQAADLLRNAEAKEVATEFRAQLMTVLDEGLSPTHLDFHSLADGGRPDLLDTAADLAADYGLALRVWLEPGRTRARTAELPVVDHPFLDSFTIDTANKADQYEQLLRTLPPGLTEWAVHPALDDSRASIGDPGGWRVRTTDREFLTSHRAAAIIREEGITLIDYRPLQRLWRTGGGLRTQVQPQPVLVGRRAVHGSSRAATSGQQRHPGLAARAAQGPYRA